MPTRTPGEVEARIVAARVEHRRGQDWLGPEPGVPARTVSRVLRPNEPMPCETSSSTTTIGDATLPSEASHPSAASRHQPDGRVQLVAERRCMAPSTTGLASTWSGSPAAAGRPMAVHHAGRRDHPPWGALCTQPFPR